VILKYPTLLEKENTSSTSSVEVISWINKAADLGHKDAMFNYSWVS
jgi:hypothetical protein